MDSHVTTKMTMGKRVLSLNEIKYRKIEVPQNPEET
jgi:hypothetical protein